MRAISYIGISHKSSGRVKDYLVRSGFLPETAQEAVDTLVSDGYIDDLRIARSLAAARTGKKSESRYALLQRLSQAGISRDVLTCAEEYFRSDEDSLSDLVDTAILPDFKKQMELPDFDAQKWMNKTFRYLMSRGFSSSLVADTLRNRIRDVE
jgi:regulatory protein